MPSNITPVGETVLKYLAEFPNYPSKTIARILFERERPLFKGVENARDLVRYYRGNKGHDRVKNLADKRFVRPSGKSTDRLCDMPDAIEEIDPWNVEQLNFKRGLIISDLHIPFHDKQSIITALRYGKKIGCDHIIINGDLIDFYAFSRFERDPRLRNPESELEATKLFLEVLRDEFPDAGITYTEGNHEQRLWRYVWERCPELSCVKGPDGAPIVNLRTLLDCDGFGIKVVENCKPLRAGEHLYILHGHEFRAPLVNPVNPARGLYNRAKANALCGHHHQTSNHTEAGLDGVVSCWSTGCLCQLHPRYMPINKWSTGFAVVELNGSAWAVSNLKIINGNVV